MVQCKHISNTNQDFFLRVTTDHDAVGAGFVPAAFGPIAVSLKVSKQQASYLTTTYTLLGGVTPLLITPLANVYGRKPMYIVS